MYRYSNEEKTHITRESDGACIPVDPNNRDYQSINLAEVGPFVPPVVTRVLEVTPWQARRALSEQGLLAGVEAAVEALGPLHAAYQGWHYRKTIKRDSVLIQTLAAGLGFTEQQLDDLFELAASIEE